MSTYFFRTNIGSPGSNSHLKVHMDKLEHSRDIEHWRIHPNHPEHVLEVETQKMSPEQVKHYIREAGFEADFTTPPQGESVRGNE